MRLLNLASANSLSRGYDYFKDGMVLDCKQIDDNSLEGHVKGSGYQNYKVQINLDKPRSSSCDCAFAIGRNVICKHMVALYLYSSPEAVKWLENEWEEAELEFQNEYNNRILEAKRFVKSLKVSELRERYLNILIQEIDDEYYGERYW